MKEVKCKLFKFNELSLEVREKLVDKNTGWITERMMEIADEDFSGSLKEFEQLMGIRVSHDVSYWGKTFSYEFKSSMPLMGDFNGEILFEEEITGKLLRRWLWRELIPYIQTPKKYYGKGFKKSRTSRILKSDDYALTGVYCDCFITDKVFEILSKPIADNYSLDNFIGDVLFNFFSCWQKEFEYWYENKENCIEVELSEVWSDRLFFEDGTMFNGTYEEEL